MTPTPATGQDLAIHATAVGLYELMFDGPPSWLPADDIDADHLALSMARDRDIMNAHTASLFETFAAGFALWAANNYQQITDEVEA